MCISFLMLFLQVAILQPTISYLGWFTRKNELYLTITKKNENWKAADGKLNTTETHQQNKAKRYWCVLLTV